MSYFPLDSGSGATRPLPRDGGETQQSGHAPKFAVSLVYLPSCVGQETAKSGPEIKNERSAKDSVPE